MPTLDLQTTDTVCIVGLSLYMVVIRYEDKLWTDNLYYPGSPRQQALSRHIQEAVREIACLAGACVIGARCWGISCAFPDIVRLITVLSRTLTIHSCNCTV